MKKIAKWAVMGMAAVVASAITPAQAVDYYDPSDGTVKASPNATTLTTQTTLSGGWYVVPAGTTTIADRITVSNSVNLVLSDGATLNANSGITVAGGNSLTIWGQGGEHVVSGTSVKTRGTGALNAQTPGSGTYSQTAAIGGEASGSSTGDIVINGGVIVARGSWGAGIGRGNVAGGAVGSVTINEGHVTASGNRGSAGIGSGAYADSCPVTISGGYVVAAGCVYDGSDQATPGIGTGRPRTNGSEPLSNGPITIIGGTVIAEAGTPPSGGTAAQAIGVNSVDADHNGTSHLVLGAVRAYASADATTPVAVSARGDTCRSAWVKLEACTDHSDSNADNICDYCGGHRGSWTGNHELDTCLETFEVGEDSIHVTGWAFDPDAPSQSINVHVRLYTDPGCTNPYGDAHVLTANVSRPDVNQAKGITGDHGFDAEIPVPDAGTYSVKLFAIDAIGNSNPQIGARLTVTAITNTVNVTKFYQSYPYSGKATIEYTVGRTLPDNAIAEITLSTDDASATFVQSNIVTGANSHVIDFASSFGGALVLTNASFVVTITAEDLGGVQLWENGPYWAECNVGATKPEEYGYYFWWGDTVGYTNTGSGWISVKDGTSISFTISDEFDSCTAASTCYKGNDDLLSEGWIDSTNNFLVAAHDAATAHLGAPWRMPTWAEIDALVRNCTATWITTNGVSGRLVTGRGAYANRSIFLPAAGYGDDSYLSDDPGWYGYYWSSTPHQVNPFEALTLKLSTFGDFGLDYSYRYYGLLVRPVRGFAR